MLGRRTFINLIAVGTVSAVLVIYGTAVLLADALRPDSYPLFAELPRAAGLLENKEVTYNGLPVGHVAGVQLVGTGVRVEMAIDRGREIPTELDVVVLRRSAIGEQAIDLRPLGPITDATEFYEAGDTVAPTQLVMPPEVDDLLETAVTVFAPIDKQAAARVVAELADTVRGRRDDIRTIMSESADLSQSLADAGDDYERLFASSRVVNAELAEHRATLSELIVQMADATTILSDVRAEFEALLVEAPPTLTLAGELVERSQPNLSCDIRYLANLNTHVAQPHVLDNAAEALRNNRYFFEGFESFTVADDFGHPWQRVLFLAPQEPPAQTYLPAKRPIADILPGGACSSPFGDGAPAATQVGYERRVPDARVVPPADDRATPVRQAGTAVPPTPAAVRASAPSGALPATGGALVPTVLGLAFMAAAGRSLSRRDGERRGETD